jgi:hypothetical protein
VPSRRPPNSKTAAPSCSSAGAASTKAIKISGDGSAELEDDGTIEIALSFDNGDDAILTGRRERLLQQPASAQTQTDDSAIQLGCRKLDAHERLTSSDSVRSD